MPASMANANKGHPPDDQGSVQPSCAELSTAGIHTFIREGFFAKWFRCHGRALPWRARPSPYGILLAEVLLRQTRAEMVARVWPSLVEQFSDPVALANAELSTVRSLVARLGLGNQRAQALLDIARAIVTIHGGQIPATLGELSALPHVGMYISHAVLCFGYGRRVPIVDTNVMRVLARIFGLQPPKDIRRAKEVWALATALLPANHVEHNYGLLDFAASICKSRGPLCSECALSKVCIHYNGTGPLAT